jgi:hypothetical protein
VLNGFVLATHTMLARQAGQGGASPILYALASAAGAAAFLALFRFGRPGSTLPGRSFCTAPSPGSSRSPFRRS